MQDGPPQQTLFCLPWYKTPYAEPVRELYAYKLMNTEKGSYLLSYIKDQGRISSPLSTCELLLYESYLSLCHLHGFHYFLIFLCFSFFFFIPIVLWDIKSQNTIYVYKKSNTKCQWKFLQLNGVSHIHYLVK